MKIEDEKFTKLFSFIIFSHENALVLKSCSSCFKISATRGQMHCGRRRCQRTIKLLPYLIGEFARDILFLELVFFAYIDSCQVHISLVKKRSKFSALPAVIPIVNGVIFLQFLCLFLIIMEGMRIQRGICLAFYSVVYCGQGISPLIIIIC